MQWMNSTFKFDTKLFDRKGEFIFNRKNELVMNSALVILRAKLHIDTPVLQYELLQCGIFIDVPELKQMTEWLEKSGYLINQTRKTNSPDGQRMKPVK